MKLKIDLLIRMFRNIYLIPVGSFISNNINSQFIKKDTYLGHSFKI